MEYQELSVDQNLVVVNKDLWAKTKQQAMYNEAEVVQMAEGKYMEYLRDNGLTLNITFDHHPIVRDVKFRLVKTNFDDRSFKDPIDKQVAQGIADQIMEYVNTKYKRPVEMANQMITNSKNQTLIDMNTKFLRGLFIGSVSTAIAITLGAVICSLF